MLKLTPDGMPKGTPRQQGSKYDEVKRAIEKDVSSLLQGMAIEYKVAGVDAKTLNNRLNDYLRRHPPNIPEGTFVMKSCKDDSVFITVKYEEEYDK